MRSCWLAAILAVTAPAQSIQDRALNTPAYSWLQELTDSIGPRLTGSPGAARAANWAITRMKEIGLENVHLEPWNLRGGWERGRAEAELTAPAHLTLNIAAYGWTGSTPDAGIDAPVVEVQRGAIADALPNAPAWTGKILFVSSRGPKPADNLAVYAQFTALVAAAERAHAAAVILRDLRPGSLLTHTGPVSFSAGDVAYHIPVLDIADEHQKLIERLLEKSLPVRLRLNVRNRFLPGPVESANVSAEIRGSEHPEQVVLLAAHLDSWDLGSGAIDDGTGVAAVLGAAEAIKLSGRKPRRTIRFVMFTGEEQGLLGSRAWVKRHAAEIPNLVCALVLDWGQGPIAALPVAGHDELKSELAPLVDLLNGIQKFRLADGFLTFTDAYTFTLAGVPGLAFYQDSRDYTLVGHSAADTYDKVDAKVLARNTATLAVAGFWIADSPGRVGAVWPSAEIPRHLTELKQRTMLEIFGLWPVSSTRPR
ncbi:MAG TPA: M20/M25/M40 family metallo-hydrolase [Candidatus Solibacter sp.]